MVVVIIGLVSAGALLALGVAGRDRQLETESERLYSLMNYAREQAELQTREFGLLCDAHGYEFVTFDPRRELWDSVQGDDILRARELPTGLELQLRIEGRPVVLRRPPDSKDRTPHVMLFSNGDVTSFELTVAREGGSPRVTLAVDEQGRIQTRDGERTT